MNLTIGNTTFNTWKRIKLQYVAVACGLAIAASAAIALPGLRSTDESAPAARPSLAFSTGIRAPGQTPHVVFYLVGSEAQAALVRAGVQEAYREQLSTGIPGPLIQTVAIVANTPDEAVAVQAMVHAANNEEQSGAVYELIDLR